MTQNLIEAGIRSSREALQNLENALADLHNDRAKIHPKTFAIMEEPIVEEIEKIRSYIATLESQLVSVPTTPSGGLANPAPVSDRA
jgi:hypothetical protein